VIWVYAICDRPDLPPPRRRGLAQAPLDSLREGALLAIFTSHAHAPAEPAPDALWAHERVVERLMADRTVLPMRFRSTVDDEGALSALLARDQQRLLHALARVQGRVEIGVRALQPASNGAHGVATVAASTGRDYLLAKLHDGRRLDRAATELHSPLEAMAVEACRQPLRSEDEILRGAYLVDQRVIARFRAAVDRLQRAHPDVAILCTGPWPPYSFVQ
jgi:hypothetical protein